jgi:hypothetical protein
MNTENERDKYLDWLAIVLWNNRNKTSGEQALAIRTEIKKRRPSETVVIFETPEPCSDDYCLALADYDKRLGIQKEEIAP